MQAASVQLDTGIYSIRCEINGKRYIGSAAKSLKLRLYEHRRLLRNGKHCNRHLQRAWNKYGEEAFGFLVIERCRPEECVSREQYWIDRCKSAEPEFGYNICPKAGSTLGRMCDSLTRSKIRAAKIGKPVISLRRPWKLLADDADFAATWNSCRTTSDVARVAGQTLSACTNRAFRLRKAGFSLKEMPKPTKTHCSRGHKYTPENTYLRACGRVCKICDRAAANRRYRQRAKGGHAVGENTGTAKLTTAQVLEIKQRYRPWDRKNGGGALARRFGVTVGTIRLIASGRSWSHLAATDPGG